MVETGRALPGSRELRRAFLWAVLPASDGTQPHQELDGALRWLRQRSLLLRALADPPVTRRVIHQLTITLDGRPAAGETCRRRRRGLAAIGGPVSAGEGDGRNVEPGDALEMADVRCPDAPSGGDGGGRDKPVVCSDV
jgi:hypothetical protein